MPYRGNGKELRDSLEVHVGGTEEESRTWWERGWKDRVAVPFEVLDKHLNLFLGRVGTGLKQGGDLGDGPGLPDDLGWVR